MRCIKLLAILALLALGLLTPSCARTERTVIEVQLHDLDREVRVELHEQGFASLRLEAQRVASPRRDRLRFTPPQGVEPTFYQVRLGLAATPTIVLLVEPGEHVTLSINMSNPWDYSVQGSEGSLRTQRLSHALRRTNRTLDSLGQLLHRATDPLVREGLEQERIAAKEAQRAYSTRFIWENPHSRAAVMALYQQYLDGTFVFQTSSDHHLFRMVATGLQAFHPESEFTQGMIRDIQEQVRIMNAHAVARLLQEAEPTLPEIALPNPYGDTIRLSSLRGRVILLDFWASGNVESLMDNRELLGIYQRHRGRGFEVFQVSLDSEPRRWVEAIASAGLPWINVSSLNPQECRAAMVYNVTQLPANYLICRDYNIVGRNLYGQALEAKLQEIL